MFVPSLVVLPAHALHGDTLISTQSGHKAIKDIQVGDVVLSKDEATGQVNYQPVSYHGSTHHLQTVYLNLLDDKGNAQTITTNQTHPFFTQTDNPMPSSEGYVYQGSIDGANWVDASNLKAGDKLLSENGNWQTVQSVKIVNQPLTAYHLTVNNTHTHFVGVDGGKYGVWVHNDSYWTPNANPNQLWAKGKLGEHFTKHGHEFGAKSSREYGNMALAFATKPNNGGLIDAVHDTFGYRFEPATNTIFVGTRAGGKIKTFYKWDGRSNDAVINYLKSQGLIQ